MATNEKSDAPDTRTVISNALSELSKHGEAFELLQREHAKLMWQKFESYRLAGFSEAQAFLLIKDRGLA